MSLSSAEVAQDFRDALQDLKVNNRPEISTLTVIAKENTESAQAISRELENHIKQTRPEWKLPALYVLDSIVKNVGTPYTVYLGRNLYNTFMQSFTLVDDNTRRAMEALLKTWKMPVPDSLDTRPVFPVDVTREIESALIKFRTNLALKQQQTQRMPRPGYPPMPSRGPQPPTPYTNTPTPPQMGGPWQPPQQQQYNNVQDPRRPQKYQALQQDPVIRSPVYPSNTPILNGYQYQQLQGRYGTPPVQNPSFTPQPGPVRIPEQLQQTLSGVIAAAERRTQANPADTKSAGLLATLKSLQMVLNTQPQTADSINTIQNEVARIAEGFAQPRPQQLQYPPAVQQLPIPPPPVSHPAATPPINPTSLAQLLAGFSTPLPAPPQPPVPVVSTPTLPTTAAPAGGNLALAQILQRLGHGPTPQASVTPQLLVPPPPPVSLGFAQPTPAPTAPPTDLFAALRAAGLLTPQPAQNIAPPPSLANSLAAAFAPQLRNDVQLTPASLKIPRPHLIERLYGARPNQCRQCGRRFTNDEAGKNKKQKHMDWHFTTNTRVAESAKSLVNRSWYIDEMEWITYREVDDSTASPTDSPKGKPKPKDPREQYVPVPTDPTLANATCPICQEKFETVWHKEVEQPVWMDAVSVGGRTYHATCWAEYSKGQPQRETTPLLGKRKFEE